MNKKKVQDKFVLRFAQDSMDDSEQSEESRTNNLCRAYQSNCPINYVLIYEKSRPNLRP